MTSVYCASRAQHCGTFEANARSTPLLWPFLPTERLAAASSPGLPQANCATDVIGKIPESTHALSSHSVSDQARLWEPMSYRESRSVRYPPRGGHARVAVILVFFLQPMIVCTQLWYFHLGWFLLALTAVKTRAGPSPNDPSLLIYLGSWSLNIKVTVRVEPCHDTSTAHRRHVDERYSL